MNDGSTASGRDDLIARAKERAETAPTPEEWGYRVVLEPGESFVGRWRGETVDEANEDRRIFLFWDEEDQLCFSRFYAALGREVDQADLQLGHTVAVFRGDDYVGQQGTGYAFGIVSEPNDAPLPEGSPSTVDDDIPF